MIIVGEPVDRSVVALNYHFPITNLMMNKMIQELNLVAHLLYIARHYSYRPVLDHTAAAAIASSSMHRYDLIS